MSGAVFYGSGTLFIRGRRGARRVRPNVRRECRSRPFSRVKLLQFYYNFFKEVDFTEKKCYTV